jgi:hypothetical protein
MQTGFFGFLGVWMAALGISSLAAFVSCLVPILGCGGILLVLAIMAVMGASHH